MKNRSATYLLICALFFAQPAAADEFGDMIGLMFRMMLGMMGAMSDVMGNNANNSGWGGGNPFGLGMTALPLMSGMSGMNPWSGFGGLPMSGMNPWSGIGGMPMTGMNPWSGIGGLPMTGMTGVNPWSPPWGNPFSGGNNPSMSPGNMNPYGTPNYGNPAGYGATDPYSPYASSSLLDGRWYGNSGVILEVRVNRFRLQNKRTAINGSVHIENDIVNLFTPQTGGVTRYTFARNQSQLILKDAAGTVLVFKQRLPNRGLRIF